MPSTFRDLGIFKVSQDGCPKSLGPFEKLGCSLLKELGYRWGQCRALLIPTVRVPDSDILMKVWVEIWVSEHGLHLRSAMTALDLYG